MSMNELSRLTAISLLLGRQKDLLLRYRIPYSAIRYEALDKKASANSDDTKHRRGGNLFLMIDDFSFALIFHNMLVFCSYIPQYDNSI